MGFNKTLVVGMLIISLVFFVVSGFLFSSVTYYGVTVDDEYRDIFNKYNETAALAADNSEIVQGGTINPEGSDQAVYTNVIIAGKQIQNSGNLFIAFLNEIPKILKIQAGVIIMLATLVTILTVFGFVRMITKEDP